MTDTRVIVSATDTGIHPDWCDGGCLGGQTLTWADGGTITTGSLHEQTLHRFQAADEESADRVSVEARREQYDEPGEPTTKSVTIRIGDVSGFLVDAESLAELVKLVTATAAVVPGGPEILAGLRADAYDEGFLAGAFEATGMAVAR